MADTKESGTRVVATRKRTRISNRKGLSDDEIVRFLFGMFDLPRKKAGE